MTSEARVALETNHNDILEMGRSRNYYFNINAKKC